MLLVDLTCTACNHQLEALIDSATTSPKLVCPGCDTEQVFNRLPTGGTKSRYRCQDWPEAHSRYWRGHADVIHDGAAVSTDGETFAEPVNRLGSDAGIKLNVDKSKERLDRLRFAKEQQHGQRPVYVTGAGSNGK